MSLTTRHPLAPLALAAALTAVTNASWASPEIVANDNGRQQSGVFGTVWLVDTIGTSTALPTASGGTINPDQPITGGPNTWSALTGLQATVEPSGIDAVSGLPRPVTIDHVSANLNIQGVNQFAGGTTPYQAQSHSFASATYGTMEIGAQGYRQLGTITGGAETMGVLTSASSVTTGNFAITIDLATALALGTGSNPYLHIDLSVTHNLVGGGLPSDGDAASPKLSVNLGASAVNAGTQVSESHLITSTGGGTEVFSLNYELTAAYLLTFNGLNCVTAQGVAGFGWVPCLFSVGVDASMAVQSGYGEADAHASLSWYVSDNVTRVNTSATQWGTQTPAVPEPQTWALIIAGLGAVGAMRTLRRA